MTQKTQVSLTFCFFLLLLLFSSWLIRVCYAPVAVSFGLSAEPLSVTIAVGGSGQSTINVSAEGNPGYLPVDLSASSISGVTTNFNPQQVTIPPSGGEWHYNQSTLTISASGSATPRVYTLTVYANFGVGTPNVNITLTILGSGYGNIIVGGYIAPDAQPTMLAPNMTLIGFVATLTVCIVVAVRKKHGN